MILKKTKRAYPCSGYHQGIESMATAQNTAVNNRARITNDPRFLRGHSGTSPAGRRRRDLVQSFVDALGGLDNLTPVQLADVRRAAELTALAEETRAKALCEGTGAVDLAALVRLEGAASRAVRALGIKSGPSAPKTPTIEEYTAQKVAQKVARASGAAGS
jgi:hypothetical protein